MLMYRLPNSNGSEPRDFSSHYLSYRNRRQVSIYCTVQIQTKILRFMIHTTESLHFKSIFWRLFHKFLLSRCKICIAESDSAVSRTPRSQSIHFEVLASGFWTLRTIKWYTFYGWTIKRMSLITKNLINLPNILTSRCSAHRRVGISDLYVWNILVKTNCTSLSLTRRDCLAKQKWGWKILTHKSPFRCKSVTFLKTKFNNG